MSPREVAALVLWAQVLENAGVDPGRKGRTCCPIHGGNNGTSFTYSDDTGYAYCFSCHWSGDKLAFLQAALNINFKTALARLADLAGVQLDDYRKPTRVEQRHLRASRTALEVTLNTYKRWCRRRWRFLCFWNYELLAEKADAELALRLVERLPKALNKEEIDQWKHRLSVAEAGIESLAWELDIFQYHQHEELRFNIWKRDVEVENGL